MTETKHIRWQETQPGIFLGYVGTLESWAFQLWQSREDYSDVALGEWVLSVQLPGALRERLPHGSDPEALMAEAEDWLAKVVSSFGAVFPEPGRVAVNEAALEAFIHEAKSTLDSLSQEFCVGAETERAAAEFEALVTALGITGTPETSAPEVGKDQP